MLHNFFKLFVFKKKAKTLSFVIYLLTPAEMVAYLSLLIDN